MTDIPSEFVTLVSSDGHTFVINRSAAYVSKTLRRMLDPANAFHESREAKAVLPPSGALIEKVCEYFYYNEKHREENNVPDMEIPPELCLELLMVADYLVT